jgi:hypothetical protein
MYYRLIKQFRELFVFCLKGQKGFLILSIVRPPVLKKDGFPCFCIFPYKRFDKNTLFHPFFKRAL